MRLPIPFLLYLVAIGLVGWVGLMVYEAIPEWDSEARKQATSEASKRAQTLILKGKGTGPIDSFVNALSNHLGIDMSVNDYSEHSMQHGSDAAAICYMEVDSQGGKLFGAGINKNIVTASLEAVVSAANRLLARQDG